MTMTSTVRTKPHSCVVTPAPAYGFPRATNPSSDGRRTSTAHTLAVLVEPLVPVRVVVVDGVERARRQQQDVPTAGEGSRQDARTSLPCVTRQTARSSVQGKPAWRGVEAPRPSPRSALTARPPTRRTRGRKATGLAAAAAPRPGQRTRRRSVISASSRMRSANCAPLDVLPQWSRVSGQSSGFSGSRCVRSSQSGCSSSKRAHQPSAVAFGSSGTTRWRMRGMRPARGTARAALSLQLADALGVADRRPVCLSSRRVERPRWSAALALACRRVPQVEHLAVHADDAAERLGRSGERGVLEAPAAELLIEPADVVPLPPVDDNDGRHRRMPIVHVVLARHPAAGVADDGRPVQAPASEQFGRLAVRGRSGWYAAGSSVTS